MLLPFDERVALPGILFFDHLVESKEAVYVPLTGLESVSTVAANCRRVFTSFSETHGVQLYSWSSLAFLACANRRIKEA